MRKREEHYNFLEHKGARQLGAQPTGCREDPVCDWCGLTNPFSGGPVLLEWDPGETTWRMRISMDLGTGGVGWGWGVIYKRKVVKLKPKGDTILLSFAKGNMCLVCVM